MFVSTYIKKGEKNKLVEESSNFSLFSLITFVPLSFRNELDMQGMLSSFGGELNKIKGRKGTLLNKKGTQGQGLIRYHSNKPQTELYSLSHK